MEDAARQVHRRRRHSRRRLQQPRVDDGIGAAFSRAAGPAFPSDGLDDDDTARRAHGDGVDQVRARGAADGQNAHRPDRVGAGTRRCGGALPARRDRPRADRVSEPRTARRSAATDGTEDTDLNLSFPCTPRLPWPDPYVPFTSMASCGSQGRHGEMQPRTDRKTRTKSFFLCAPRLPWRDPRTPWLVAAAAHGGEKTATDGTENTGSIL